MATAKTKLESGARTRAALIDAGMRLAATEGLSGISVNRLVAEAGVAKGTFYVHFSDREAFLGALHHRFYEKVGASIAAATRGLQPGANRLGKGLDAYLDACLGDRAIRAMLLEARSRGMLPPTGTPEQFADIVERDLRAERVKDAPHVARMVVAAASECALVESDAGGRRPAARRALRKLAIG